MPPFNRRWALGAMMALGLAGAAAAAAPVVATDIVMGDAAAKVTVVEYASLACPHCARFNNEVLPAFKAKYVDTGKVRFVFREFLTEPVQVAAAGALIARCSDKARRFAAIDAFFQGQAEMYRTENAGPLFLAAGEAGGLSEDEVRACLTDRSAIEALQTRVKRYAEADKIKSTPTVLVNGKRVEGMLTLESLSAAIDPLLKGARTRAR